MVAFDSFYVQTEQWSAGSAFHKRTTIRMEGI